MSPSTQLCTFLLDDKLFGLEVEKVQEVIRFQEMTPVPLAPPVVEGLINLRGQIISAIDLRRRLEFPQRAEDVHPMNVVLRTDEEPVSLLVDEIGDVIEIDQGTFEMPPDTLDGEVRELIRGAYKLENCLLLLLDAERAIDVSKYAQ